MTQPHLSPAGVRAGKAALCPEFRHEKTLLIAGQGEYFVRARERLDNAPVALRITPKTNFGAIRNETIR